MKINKILDNKFVEKGLILLIILNLCVFCLDTTNSFHLLFGKYIPYFEAFSIAIFTIEYILRLISLKNIKEVFKPMMIIDFFAIFPYYLTFCNMNTVFLRIFRLSRLIRILKINRYSDALNNIVNGFKEKKEELIITFSIFCVSILLFSILIYFAEHDAQPDIFSSIPQSLSFGVSIFTTANFGDVHPITTTGKILCGITSILGIAVHGVFIGIISMAFISIFNKDCKR